jgi:NADPH-dependent curcumin reductase CurA
MTAKTNRQVRLAARPSGLPTAEVWEHTEEPVGEPGAGEVLVEVLLLSLDPAMRGWMNEGRSYVPPVEVGTVMRAGGAGRVVASGDERFAKGDHVSGLLGAQEYALVPADGLQKVDPEVAPLATHVGALGMTGMTAYFGLLDVGDLQEGDTVVVSGAAGAVGSVVGQIAKLKGARAVGIAGGPEKCAWLTEELGFDAAIDYRGTEKVSRALRTACPDGIDVYFDNVGGEILDAALARLRRGARVPICGGISQYNVEGRPAGPANYLNLIAARARMEGFLVFDYAAKFPAAAKEMAGWLADGRLVSREHIVQGDLTAFPETFRMLFRGANTGKLVLQITEG